MSMNRRGFFGVGAGAAVAGPDIAQQMAQKIAFAATADAAKVGTSQGVIGYAKEAFSIDPETAVRRAFKMGLVSREQIGALLENGRLSDSPSIYNLDSDLQAAKSFSLATRIRMQRERSRERGIDRWLDYPERDQRSLWDMGRELLMKGLIPEDAA